jgi:DNA-binding NtrC family response regulator
MILGMHSRGPKLLRVLIVDESRAQCELISNVLAADSVETVCAYSAAEALRAFGIVGPHLVFLSAGIQSLSGTTLLERITAVSGATEVVVMAEEYSRDAATDALHKGAVDYVVKPLDAQSIRRRAQDLFGEILQFQSNLQFHRQLAPGTKFEGIVGRSAPMQELFSQLRRVAPHYSSVLLTGDTGTGKELAAEALHNLSPAKGPFVPFNCASLVDGLAESELFGYVKGAFTGANQDRAGLFEFAHGGTVFLDEIGELPISSQAKLLRVLQCREIRRVGSPGSRSVDVRVIAATNRNLRDCVAEKSFREDLYYRLSMVEIKLPTLAERKEDLPLLQEHFLRDFRQRFDKKIVGLTCAAEAMLESHSWPGNVRELENVLGAACMNAAGTIIDVRDLPLPIQACSAAKLWDSDLISCEELQRRHAKRVLDKLKGNKHQTAEVLGISRSTLYRLLQDDVPLSKAASA